MKSLWPSLVALLGSAASIYSSQIAAFWAAHQHAAIIMAGTFMVFTHFMPSPLQSKPLGSDPMLEDQKQ